MLALQLLRYVSCHLLPHPEDTLCQERESSVRYVMNTTNHWGESRPREATRDRGGGLREGRLQRGVKRADWGVWDPATNPPWEVPQSLGPRRQSEEAFPEAR